MAADYEKWLDSGLISEIGRLEVARRKDADEILLTECRLKFIRHQQERHAKDLERCYNELCKRDLMKGGDDGTRGR